jgi:hypothetical protein
VAALDETMKLTTQQVRDPQNFKKVRRGDHVVYQYLHDVTWHDWVYVAPSKHGRGLFAARAFAAGDPVVAYRGDLWRAEEHRKPGSALNDSPGVMQSGIKDWLIRGDERWAAYYANDKRGSGKKANIAITVQQPRKTIPREQLKLFRDAGRTDGTLGIHSHPQAVGTVLPYYKTTRAVKKDQEFLTNYDWPASDWAKRTKA